jgi:hypothetical protein
MFGLLLGEEEADEKYLHFSPRPMLPHRNAVRNAWGEQRHCACGAR